MPVPVLICVEKELIVDFGVGIHDTHLLIRPHRSFADVAKVISNDRGQVGANSRTRT